jgi:hypothetical protein
MKRKWGILFVLIPLAVLAAVFLPAAGDRNPIVVRGHPSPQDVAEIRKLVKKDMRGRIFPNLSTASFKGLSANVSAYLKYHIVEINTLGPSSAMVMVGDSTNVTASKRICGYSLIKDSNEWKINVIYAALSPLPRGAIPVPAPVVPNQTTNSPLPLLNLGAIPSRPMRSAADFSGTQLSIAPSGTFTNSPAPALASATVSSPAPGSNAYAISYPGPMASPPSLKLGQSLTDYAAKPAIGGRGRIVTTMATPIYALPGMPGRVLRPTSAMGLTNLMPIGP